MPNETLTSGVSSVLLLLHAAARLANTAKYQHIIRVEYCRIWRTTNKYNSGVYKVVQRSANDNQCLRQYRIRRVCIHLPFDSPS